MTGKLFHVSVLTFFLFLCFLAASDAHIGQPCSWLGICWPPNIHIYCDDSRICRCRPETPVVVGPHQCKRDKSHGDKCSSDQECLYSDNHMFCDSNLCNCVTNYTYDPYLMRCIHASINQRSGFNIFYTMLSSAAIWIVLLLIALFISIPCCLAFLYHCFCYEKASGETTLCRESSIRLRYAESGANSEGGGGGGSTGDPGTVPRISLLRDDPSSRQSYELSCFDEPPPSYDEACKRCLNAPTIGEQRNDDTTVDSKMT